MAILVEPMKPEDWPRVRDIYREGIETRHATFEPDPPCWEAFDGGHLEAARLVARAGGPVIGWAALSPVSDRPVYEGVAEVSVYVGKDARGQRVGGALLERLVGESEAAGVWTLQAGIFPENRASLTLHESQGFRNVGVSERLGRMEGRWRDVVLLERRSASVGTD